MRLIYIPLDKSHRLIYAQKTLIPKVRQTPRFDEKILAKATKTWQGFEESDTKWKKSLVSWSNKLLERIPYAEWSLRTVPSINMYKRVLKKNGEYISPEEIKDFETVKPVGLVYPSQLIKHDEALESVKKLATTGLAHHRKFGIWSVIAMPFTAPVALLPVVPNIPFFYLVYRAYCHWEAYNGAKHLLHLIEKNQLVSEKLPAIEKTFENWDNQLTEEQETRISRIFGSKELDNELKRALRQTRKQEEKELKEKESQQQEQKA